MKHVGTFLRLIYHLFMNPHKLCKSIGTVWVEYLDTRPPTLWVVVGFLTLFVIGFFYVCWIGIYCVINRIIMGRWGLD